MVCAVKRLSGGLYICGFCLEIKKDTVLIQEMEVPDLDKNEVVEAGHIISAKVGGRTTEDVTTFDKRLHSTLITIGVNVITPYEEINIFKDDVVIQILNLKVQAFIGANTWVVSGSP